MGILHIIMNEKSFNIQNQGKNTTIIKHVQFLMDSFELTPSQSTAARMFRQAEHLSS